MIKGSGSRNPQVSVRLDISRRSLIKATVGMSAILAAGAAPAIIRNAGAAGRRKISFMLPFLFVGGHAFEFVAQAEGWKDRGLDVDIVRGYGSGAACKAISAGQVDFGEASYGVMVNSISSGINNVAIGVKLQKSPISITCRADSGVTKPKDMEGKTLVNSAASGDTLMLPGFAKGAGIDVSKINIQNVHPSKLVSTVLNNQAHCAGSYYVSIGAALQHNTDVVHFLYADYGLNTLDLGLIARAETIKNDHQLVQDFVDGAMEGLKVQLLEPERALDYMVRAKEELRTVDRSQLARQLGNTNALVFGPAVEQEGLGWMAEEDQKRTRELVIEYMEAKDVPPTGKMFTNEFAGKVKLTSDEWRKAKSLAAKYDPKRG
jgi:NitT/TauT family transport system substrate-binding protein